MRTGEFIKGVALILALATLVLAPTTCGGGNQRVAPAIQPASDTSLNDALAELAALETPEGVDTALFRKLKDALASLLTTNNQHLPAKASATAGPATARFVSAPPTGDANRVTDLNLTDNGDGTFSLSWHYRNLGDYDQDGTVAIEDIIPLAEHFGEEVPDEDDNSLQAFIDGTGNGVIDIADITPLAINYGVECVGYSIRGASSSPDTLDDTSEIGIVGIANAADEGRKHFIEPLPENELQFFAVVPYDGESSLGDLSNVAILPMPLWHTMTVDSAGDVGLWTSLAAVNGNPAISYDADGSIKYVRATDSIGASWGAPLILAIAAPSNTSLAVVNGKPAISYCGGPGYDLKYIRATDVNGGSWGAEVTVVDNVADASTEASLAVVNGYPAISYHDGYPDLNLKFVRAKDNNGVFWGTPVVVDSAGPVGWDTSLAVVNGYPAISYRAAVVGLKYAQANDINGESWSTPVFVDEATCTGNHSSLAVVNGNPAISYCDHTNDDLKFAIYY